MVGEITLAVQNGEALHEEFEYLNFLMSTYQVYEALLRKSAKACIVLVVLYIKANEAEGIFIFPN